MNVDGTPKGQRSVARLIASYAKRRAGIVVSPHQFRHLSAKVVLDAQPGAFETVRQLLGHKNDQTTVNAYAGSTAVARLVITSISSTRPSPMHHRRGSAGKDEMDRRGKTHASRIQDHAPICRLAS